MNLHFEQLKTIGVVISSLGIDSSAESSLGLDAIRSSKEHQSDRRNLLNKTEHWLTVPKRHRINKAFSYWRSYLKLELSVYLCIAKLMHKVISNFKIIQILLGPGTCSGMESIPDPGSGIWDLGSAAGCTLGLPNLHMRPTYEPVDYE